MLVSDMHGAIIGLRTDCVCRSCTGIMHPADDNALNTEERIWDLTMQINVKGVWWGCKYAILAMRQNPTDESKGLHVGGSIINTASFVGSMGAATPQLACMSFSWLLASVLKLIVAEPYRYIV